MPAHARRIKIRRKALRQPDEFHTLTSQAMAWLDAHRELAAGIALAALVAAAAVVAVSQYRASQVGRAAESFRAAQATFEARHFADAAAAFEVLGETYPRTPSGRLAGLYRAHALAHQGDTAGAATAYREYLTSRPAADHLPPEPPAIARRGANSVMRPPPHGMCGSPAGLPAARSTPPRCRQLRPSPVYGAGLAWRVRAVGIGGAP